MIKTFERAFKSHCTVYGRSVKQRVERNGDLFRLIHPYCEDKVGSKLRAFKNYNVSYYVARNGVKAWNNTNHIQTIYMPKTESIIVMCVCNLASIDFSIMASCNHNPSTPASLFYNVAQTFLKIFFHYPSNSYFFIACVVTIWKIFTKLQYLFLQILPTTCCQT